MRLTHNSSRQPVSHFVSFQSSTRLAQEAPGLGHQFLPCGQLYISRKPAKQGVGTQVAATFWLSPYSAVVKRMGSRVRIPRFGLQPYQGVAVRKPTTPVKCVAFPLWNIQTLFVSSSWGYGEGQMHLYILRTYGTTFNKCKLF